MRHLLVSAVLFSAVAARGGFHWLTGDWAPCRVATEACPPGHPSLIPVYGHKKREVWCANHDEKAAAVDASCQGLRRPQDTFVCFGHCPECQGTWSSWSPSTCGECVGRQRRTLSCADDRVLEERRACFSPTLCTSSKAISQTAISQQPSPLRPPEALTASFVPYLHVGAWSPCLTEVKAEASKKTKAKRNAPAPFWTPPLPADLEISFVAESVPSPPHGVQTRAVQCRGQDGEPLPLRVCVDGHSQTLVPAKVRSCVTSQPCITSTWSEWGDDDINGCHHGRRGVKRLTRHRKINHLPQGSGQACPHLVEHRLLTEGMGNHSCPPKYLLVASGWSRCRVADINGEVAICGGGLQDRNVSCLLKEGRRPVELSFCSHLPQLPRVQRCFVPCTGRCLVGAWSSWSRCIPKDCSLVAPHLPGRQTRRRRLLQSSSSCPHLEESRDCSISSCYAWRLEKREECYLPRGTECGDGTRKLLFACLNGDGTPAPTQACGPKPPFEEPCHLQCPDECVLSAWSQWSSCPSPCTTSGLRASRIRFSHRNRTLLAVGTQQPCQGDTAEVRPCPPTQCDTYHWRAGLWGPCLVLNHSAHCGSGVRKREVICVMYNLEIVGREVARWRCRDLETPAMEETCRRPCPRDCQLTEWSSWTSCEDLCQTTPRAISPTATSTMPSFTVIMNTQSRYRRVLQWPRHGGLSCSRLIDVRPCPLQSSQSCPSRTWRPQPWSSCILPRDKRCGEGIQVRGLDCLSAGGSWVDLSECLGDADLMARPLPTQYQPCSVDCVNQCVTGPWSSWSSCSRSCPSRRTRSRLLSNEVKCASLHGTEEEACACQNYRTVPSGDYSDCLITTDSSLCGIGKRYRRLHCLDSASTLVEPNFCGNQTWETEQCRFPCPVDCQMSPWTEWGVCNAVCGYGLKNRTAKVVRLASVGGRPCPGPSVQYALCNYPCEHFLWVTSAWSACLLLEDTSSCGRGRKTRTIRCVEKTSDSLEMDVPSHYCDPEEKPADSQDCQIHCPLDCVHDEWTPWSACHSDDCVERGFQRRNRTLLRTAATSEEKCSSEHLQESRPCDQACFFRYEWSLTPWSSCLPDGDSFCGEGKRRRGIKCIRRPGGRAVRESLCAPLERPTELETWCPTDCPVDCEVSPWSPWELTACTCGRQTTVNMTRTRVISTEASPSGRPCPAVMNEARPCPSRPCYSVHFSPANCDLQGAACGVGSVRSNVTCRRIDAFDFPEELERCGHDFLPMALGDHMCFRPCPTDCVLSAWSAWSECRGGCVSSPSWGSRTRRRTLVRPAVRPHGQCLSERVERQTCRLTPCFTYRASLVEDEVQCIRSDGLIVEDALCDLSPPRPPYFDHTPEECQPPCRVLHSKCGKDYKCRCLPGYRPTYLPAPILSSRPPTLVYCQSLAEVSLQANVAMTNGSFNGTPEHNGTLVPMSYFPDDAQLNPWMLAMIGIGCVFIAFVGVSIYLMCKSTNQEVVRVPKD